MCTHDLWHFASRSLQYYCERTLCAHSTVYKTCFSDTLAVSTIVRHFHVLQCIPILAFSFAFRSFTLSLLLRILCCTFSAASFCCIFLASSPLLYHFCSFPPSISRAPSFSLSFRLTCQVPLFCFSSPVPSFLTLLSCSFPPALSVSTFLFCPSFRFFLFPRVLFLVHSSAFSLPPFYLSGLKVLFSITVLFSLASFPPSTATVWTSSRPPPRA